jgi:hypothetical protein
MTITAKEVIKMLEQAHLTPQQAKELARRYFSACLQRMEAQLADNSSHE